MFILQELETLQTKPYLMISTIYLNNLYDPLKKMFLES